MPAPVIVHGNPCDGITIIGPFSSPHEAKEWAKTNLDCSDGDHFWSTPLYSPDEFLENKTERVQSIVTFDETQQQLESARRDHLKLQVLVEATTRAISWLRSTMPTHA